MLALLLPNLSAYAADDTNLKAERRAAQQQRQLLKKERNKNNQAAVKSFREFTRELKQDYKEQLRQLGTDFKLQSIELKAERNSKIALAEQGMQQTVTQLMMNSQKPDNQEAIEKLKAEIKQHSDTVFAIKKQSTQEFNKEMLNNERKKHQLLTEQDQKALQKAQSLGLRGRHKPLLAEAIGGELTDKEQKWNEREAKEVDKTFKRNQRLLGEFIHGSTLREWEIGNKQQDFNLAWQQKEELHAINSEQVYYTLFSFAGDGNAEANQQQLSQKISEITTQTRLINIKYQKLKEQNKVKRREKKRQITGR
jgi:hypothetical protein